MEPRRPAGGGSSGAYRDADQVGSSLPQRNGRGSGRQTDPGGRPRRQSDRVVRADSVTRRRLLCGRSFRGQKGWEGARRHDALASKVQVVSKFLTFRVATRPARGTMRVAVRESRVRHYGSSEFHGSSAARLLSFSPRNGSANDDRFRLSKEAERI